MESLVKTYFPVAWLGHIGLGLTVGSLGPVQPYFASQVGVSHQDISLIWSCLSVSVAAACFASGALFNLKLFQNPRYKILTFTIAKLIVSASAITLPFIKSYNLLLLAILFMCLFVGFFDTGNNGFVFSMLGPQHGRPFIQSLHACTALGFTLIAVIIPLFLPNTDSSREAICDQLHGKASTLHDTPLNSNITADPDADLNPIEDTSLPILFYPFLIIGLWELLVSCGFLTQVCCGIKIPNFYVDSQTTSAVDIETLKDEKERLQEKEQQEQKMEQLMKNAPNEIAVMICGYLFFVICAGLDSYFQSQTYIFGLCGPMAMTASEAGYLNTTYFASYLIGRILSIPLSRKLHPTTILLISLSGTFLTSVLLLVFGGTDPRFLFLGTGLMGFCVCFQFASSLTWLTSLFPNFKQYHTSVMFLGATTGIFIFPMLASHIFEIYGATSVFYLTTSLTSLHIVLYFIMRKIF